MSEKTALQPMPADSEVFEMTLDGDAPENDPMEMVRRDGRINSKNWRFAGRKIPGRQTRRFMWVSIDYQPNLEAVRQRCLKRGEIPEGQWLEAVKCTFLPDGKLRGIADPSWMDPVDDGYFPFVYGNGRSSFCWSGTHHDSFWRWLVEVE